MLSRITKASSVTIICCIFSVLVFLEAPAECDAMSITPDRIILNAECVGNEQDIQAIFFGVGLQNDTITGLNADFYFDGNATSVSNTDLFHYCWIDDNLLISFDRSEIQEHAKDNGMTDGTWTVTVKCTVYLLENPTKTLEGSDQVKILAKGKKK